MNGFHNYVPVATNGPANKRRVVLSKASAFEIYRLQIKVLMQRSSLLQSSASMNQQSVHASKLFGASPKTIRDIWSRRTWQHATDMLWRQEDLVCPLSQQNKKAISLKQVVRQVTITIF
jgi:hypothetical protein